jgi:hypothetical protein
MALSRFSIGLACGVVAVATVAWGATRAGDGARAPAKRFLATLIGKSSAAMSKPQGCLASPVANAPATVGGELAAIFGRYIDSGWSFAISASCDTGESATRQFCTLTFAHKDKANEASAGFTFLGNPADGSIDTGTLECFQTP